MILRDAIQFLRGVLEQTVMISRGAIQFLRGVLERKDTNSQNDNLNSVFFVRSGCEYYAVARFAMHGQLSYVCGNLFHHAVEMLLKAGLAKQGKDLDALKDMGHSLKKLWRAYKAGHSKADLERHTKTIRNLSRYLKCKAAVVGENKLAQRIAAEHQRALCAIRLSDLALDNHPGSDELIFERLLLSYGAAVGRGQSEGRDCSKTEHLRAIHLVLPVSMSPCSIGVLKLTALGKSCRLGGPSLPSAHDRYC
jgi:hypothetical protein